MPFPTYPDNLEKKTLADVERSTKVEIDLGKTLTKLETAFGKIDAAAFAVPKKIATEKEVTDLKSSLDGEVSKITPFVKSLAEFNKAAFATTVRLKKEKANPAAIKHVEKMVSAGTAFAKTMADLSAEADELVNKARLLLEAGNEKQEPKETAKETAKETTKETTKETPVVPKADKFLLQGLNAIKSQGGLFALAVGSEGPYLVAGPRLAPELLKKAKAESGGGNFVRGDCEWSGEKSAFVFVLGKKPPAGLAKKARKAILDQTKLQVKVLVRGPDGKEIDADNDADTMGAVETDDAPEIMETPSPAKGNGDISGQIWNPARVEARGKLRNFQTLLAKTKHPLAAETVVLIEDVLKKVDVDVADRAGVEKLAGHINNDPEIADLETIQLEGESFGIRAALLKALQSLGKQLPS